MRNIGVVTVARSDYTIYYPFLRAIQRHCGLDLRLIVAGMHLSPEFGSTINIIESEGFPVHERIEMLLSSDSPEGLAKSIGIGIMGFSQSFGRQKPDILMVLGDRFEMLSAACAALPFGIPIAHIHGGESTEGAIDEAIRHSITKMSHLHFVTNEVYARRVVQMGEEPWRVTLCGAPSLDNLHDIPFLSAGELSRKFGLDLDRPPLLVTFHPVTLEYERTDWHMQELLQALAQSQLPVVFTYPNADTHGRRIIHYIDEFVNSNPLARKVVNLGTQGYFSLMKASAAMVGNSSSGIIEAASLGLPVVNIGNRQRGRVHGRNVLHTHYDHVSILDGIKKATDPGFKRSLQGMKNPYGDGHAAERIIARLVEVRIDAELVMKRFHNLG